MAGLNDIDLQAAVRKYLESSLITPRSETIDDTSAEISALFETIALTFLLYPQVALTFILRAANSLLQMTRVDHDMLVFMRTALADLGNPNEAVEDTSDLIEAQTALLELDRVGRVQEGVQAFDRYNTAVQRFLNQQLAKELKRHARGDFERSGQEARQDLFTAYASLEPLHRSLISRLQDLAASVASYQSVDLSKLVSAATIGRIRDSLDQIKSGLDQNQLSKTTAAIDLLAGAAALRSISGTAGIYDPTVQSGSLPLGRDIHAAAPVAYAHLDLTGPWDVSGGPYQFKLKVDGGLLRNMDIPEDEPRIVSEALADPLVVPAGVKFYLAYRLAGSSVFTISETTMTAGSRTLAQIQTEINAGMAGFGVCTLEATRLALTCTGTTEAMTVLGRGNGTFAGGVFTPADPSCHVLLGFRENQASDPLGTLGVETFARLAAAVWPELVITQIGNDLMLASPTADAAGSLEVGAANTFPYVTPGVVQSEPDYLTLQEDATDLDPDQLGVYPGSRVTVFGDRGLSAPIDHIVQTRLYFIGPLPRGRNRDTTVLAPTVLAVQQLMTTLAESITVFDSDLFHLQAVLVPVISQATPAQINDLRRVLDDMVARINGLGLALGQAVVPTARQSAADKASHLMASLEDRHLDRAIELLGRVRFSDFFALGMNSASKGARFLRALENVGRNEFGGFTQEDNQDTDVRAPEAPDAAVFPDREPSD